MKHPPVRRNSRNFGSRFIVKRINRTICHATWWSWSLVLTLVFAAATSGVAAADLPIELEQIDQPGSLRRVHLYSLRDEPLADGERFEFVGRSAKPQGMLIFCDPPWIHVTCREGDNEAVGVQQAFAARPERLPAESIDGGIFRASGVITRHRPDLTYHQRERLGLHHFNLRDATLTPLKTALDDDAARGVYARETTRARMRLEGRCRQLGLNYVGPHDKTPGVSWYKGCLAVTDVVTPKPIYSRSPVIYATASVVIDPAGGEPLRIILQRRIHQDPPD